MTSKQLHLIVHDGALVAMNVSIFIFLYTINLRMAVIIGGLYCIKTISGFLYALEQKRQDQEMMDEIDKILKSERDE